MSIYNNQKTRFSQVQSNYHKLLNCLREEENDITMEQSHSLIKINEMLERIDYYIQEFNEQKETDPDELENIRINDVVINTFKPLMFALRFFMD
tara:strand:- start:143 stop:424 length:282 start_codon:yes stop_codon:yes gene_type:complete